MANSAASLHSALNSDGASINPFASPAVSLPATRDQSITSGSFNSSTPRPRRRFKSSRLVGEFDRPWLFKKDSRARYERWILYACVCIGIAIGAVMCYVAVSSVPKHDYCMVLDDSFTSINPKVWSHEIQVDGFGTGSFDWTTDDPANSYTSSAGLHIVPTLTLQSTNITGQQLLNGYAVNLTSDGVCTSSTERVKTQYWVDPCIVVSNASSQTIINPVRSARLTTAGKLSIKYGRVEVTAKMPKGDWLWPAIWMMPEDSVYGAWPRSGEIDIAEFRSNDATTYPLGNNMVGSALHWGLNPTFNAYYKTKGDWSTQRTKYSDAFHTYGLEWSAKYIFMWVDGRLKQILFTDFAYIKDLWTYGGFAATPINGSTPSNPWINGGQNAPFDQSFHLILNVAVGATNGYFPDSVGNKPWDDNSYNAAKGFWEANSTWLPTWGAGEDRGMTVKSVKIWQEGKCAPTA